MTHPSHTNNFLYQLNSLCGKMHIPPDLPNDPFISDDDGSDPDWSLSQEMESNCNNEPSSSHAQTARFPTERSDSTVIDQQSTKFDKVHKTSIKQSSVSHLTYSKPDTFICMVCLVEEENDWDISNQLMCRYCGITVHTQCYYYSYANQLPTQVDLESADSERHWVCEPCSSGAKYLQCELCPSTDRIPLKQTQNGLWVHLICAQYTNAIYPDSDGLSLDHLKGSLWGVRACSLCSGERRWMGVCCRCDAGKCKNYCHATCAQKMGLLNNFQDMQPLTQHNEKEQACPFYYFCTQHRIKECTALRSKAWKKALERTQQFSYSFSSRRGSISEEQDSFDSVSNPAIPFIKTERFLQFSPTFRMAMQKKYLVFQKT